MPNERSIIKWAGYSSTGWENVTAHITQRTLAYPYGRCISISPVASPPRETSFRNRFYLRFNDTYMETLGIKTVKLFLMDKTNSPRLYPDDTEMIGDPVTIDQIADNPRFFNYKAHISRSQNIEGDPSLECADYTTGGSYYDCIQSELKQTFNKTIGCLPPPVFPEPSIMCNRKFNFSSKGDETKLMLLSLYNHDYKFNCKTPCQTNKYSTNLLHHEPKRDWTGLSIIFDNTVKVIHTKFSTDTETLLTGFGGAVSSGRTLLWIFVSFLGASQVIFTLFPILISLKLL